MLGCNQLKYTNPHAVINTAYGEIEVELFPAQAPKTVRAFLSYIDSGYYKNAAFYRVLTNTNVPAEYNTGLVQGGIYTTNPKKLAVIPGIPHEPNSLTHLLHTNGTISLARTAPGTASTEFFICIGDQPQFDSNPGTTANETGFAAFGKVFSGMDIVKRIQNSSSQGEAFDHDIKIISIERLK